MKNDGDLDFPAGIMNPPKIPGRFRLLAFLGGKGFSFGVVMSILGGIILAFVLVRFGFFALACLITFDQFSRLSLPLLGDYPAWYARPVLVYAIVLAGFLLYGAYISLGGRSLFGSDEPNRLRRAVS